MSAEVIEIEIVTDKKTKKPSIPSWETANPQLKNLARAVPEERLKTWGGELLALYREDDLARKEWMDTLATWLEVYNQQDYKSVQEPFPGASRDNIPILTESVNQFANRAIQLIFNQSEFIRARPFGMITEADMKAAKRVEKYLNYYLMVRDRNYKKRLKAALKAIPLYGSFFRKRFWNPETRRIEVVNIEPSDFIAPIGVQPCDIRDLERKTHRYTLTESRARRLYRMGYFLSLPKGENIPLNEVDEVKASAQGIEQNYKSRPPVTILEMHTELDINDDDMPIPVIVWMTESDGTILRIAPRYKVDRRKEVIQPANALQSATSIPNPDFGEALDYNPQEYFTHFYFSTNPNGFYAEGMGTLLAATNRSVNRMLRQCIDAGTLANIPSGLASKQLGLNKGTIRLVPGELTPIDATVDDIRKSIYMFDFKGPNATLMNLMNAVIARTDRLGMLTDAITGTTDKVIQPTTFLNLIEQGLQPFTASMVNVQECLSEELNAIYELLGEYMDEEEYFTILDGDELQTESVSPEDFNMSMDLVVVADPKLATDRQRQDRAQRLFEILMNHPLVQQDPEFINKAYKLLLETFDVQNIDELLPQAPQPLAPAPEGVPSPAGIPPEALQALTGAPSPTGTEAADAILMGFDGQGPQQ